MLSLAWSHDMRAAAQVVQQMTAQGDALAQAEQRRAAQQRALDAVAQGGQVTRFAVQSGQVAGAGGFVSEKLRLRYFPMIAARIPEFRGRTLYRHVFLSKRSAAFDLAITAAAVAVARRSRLPLIAAVPYARLAASDTRRFRRRAPLVAAVRALADATTLGALLAGSVKARSVVL